MPAVKANICFGLDGRRIKRSGVAPRVVLRASLCGFLTAWAPMGVAARGNLLNSLKLYDYKHLRDDSGCPRRVQFC
jgi:hypothetical protein